MKGGRFCIYCRRTKVDQGFKMIPNSAKGSAGAQCPACQDIRKKPRVELEALAKRESQERSARASRVAKQAAAERRKNE